jgi:UDP-N-acetylmuramate dehydrogenase
LISVEICNYNLSDTDFARDFVIFHEDMTNPEAIFGRLKFGVRLSEYTTIGLGGDARYLISCETMDEIRSALRFSEREHLRVEVLGGGSNIIFSDHGINGLVIKIDLKGYSFEENGEYTTAVISAGESWDDFVKTCVERNLAGVECLSGIPGTVGATPIQNVGAYGQEVKDTILFVRAIDRKSLKMVEFSADECGFGYRQSRFKLDDRDKFIIVEVCFRLKKDSEPLLKYRELKEYIELKNIEAGETGQGVGKSKLQVVRDAVLTLRKRKSMLIDPSDPNSRSVGSFFLNPILSEVEYAGFKERLVANGILDAPIYKEAQGIKISAAWLVENSGFRKGYRRNGVGISSNHALALVNYGGTTKDILSLASDIEEAVYKKFGIRLKREAVVLL